MPNSAVAYFFQWIEKLRLNYAYEMLKNYLRIALRSFQRQKVYSIVNLSGLTLAISVAILAILFIRHELSYDHWIPNSKNIYQVYRQWDPGQGTAFTPQPLAEALRHSFPEITHATRMKEQDNVLVATDDQQKSLYVEHTVQADSSFLQVFPFPLRYGDAATAMHSPSAVLLSEELAQALFGNEDPLGKIVVFNDETDFEVTGVIAEFQGNTHFDIDIVLQDTTQGGSWTGNWPATFVALHDGVDVANLEQKITEDLTPRLKAEVGDSWDQFPDWRLQQLTASQLDSDGVELWGSFSGEGNMETLYIIGIVALLILMIAGINYMNLATAQATRRAREVGVRKVTGASNQQLITQFLAEATLQALIALPAAMLLTGFILPAFETIVDRNLALDWAVWQSISPYLLAIVLVLGLLSGSYPAFFLAAYRPADVLKGQWLRKDKSRVLRNGMVVAQFTGAMVAAIVMFFIYQQVQYMQTQELGFQAEQVVVVKANTQQTYEKVEATKQELLRNPNIQSVSANSTVPGQFESDFSFQIDGRESDAFVDIYFADAAYADVLGLKIIAGRFLSPSDTSSKTFVVNEEFVKEYDLEDPIGHAIRFSWEEEPGTIIGIVEDFHYQHLQNDIKPLVISGAIKSVRDGWINNVAIRLSSENIRATIADIEQYWKQVEPAHPMRYTFLDDDFSKLYAEQERLGKTLLYATLLTLLIASMGLFALASYMAEQRIKEIGLRKVLGASVRQIVVLMGKDFLKLVLIAGLVAAPIAFWLADQWLANFAYAMDMSILPFAMVILVALIVAFVTVSSKAIQAAHANPVDSLRSE
ncbi:putative ABC transport system permease protein [Catalinimonas alkaloidigena]|uniref:ABC transporter permease n=1 Tax=Catalinimonas alkaloidigena TaxID=1075417 RepID=UPI0024070C1B|nr:ABC transporter permease [Catalinimonas alkaloidigena]MDF9800165.1 putative ABC transport system permease protein [Catalinimonas alkaloidigena]